jgi:mRNA interferase MazF
MVVQRGDIWWGDLPVPTGSNPGYRRPMLIVQADRFNRSQINTVIIAVITTNTDLVNALGNVLLTTKQSGLPKNSVVNVSQLYTIDESHLIDYVDTISDSKMKQVDDGLRLVLSL